MIAKLLIANRGEIAVRIIRAAREMGISTVAVYSDADRHSMHVALADEAVFLGDPEPSASYLSMDKILDAARTTGSDAVHPGYGFLSERADFADACAVAGVVFVGPPAAAMRKLGSKIEAKQLAVQAGVPVTPGFFESGAPVEQLFEAAKEIGFPVMLKASAGGGGRGMRIVRNPASFLDDAAIASDEAKKGFGDGAMMVEKLIESPRHIEAQILADSHGNVAVLFERECSLQRRHQKLVEEAPSPAFAQARELWEKMRTSVSTLISMTGYTGAGTAEFMFDEKSGEFYFLEVNARLQVEHPVTECITGVDLVQEQIRIASGLSLQLDPRLRQGDRSYIRGHSIEARIVAEDPARDFLPSIGPILAWAEPKAPGIRIDTGFGPGSEVSRYYDSLLAKVVAHAPTRIQAIDKLRSALVDFHILGIKTNVSFLLDVLNHPDFVAGRFDTSFLACHFGEWKPAPSIPDELGTIMDHVVLAHSDSNSNAVSGAWDATDVYRN